MGSNERILGPLGSASDSRVPRPVVASWARDALAFNPSLELSHNVGLAIWLCKGYFHDVDSMRFQWEDLRVSDEFKQAHNWPYRTVSTIRDLLENCC